MPLERRPAIAVIGVGNALRGDDGAGPAVLGRLRAECPAGVELCESDGEVTGLLDALSGRRAAIVVDAVCSGAEAGTVHCWRDDAPALAVLRSSTHALGVADALALAEALQRRPHRVTVVAIEARHFAPGEPLSPPVAQAVDPAAAVVRRELAHWLQEVPPCTSSR